MVLFGSKAHSKKFFLGYFYPPTLSMQKYWVKMVPKQVFTGVGFQSPSPLSMSIPEAPSRRVKEPTLQLIFAQMCNVYVMTI